MKRREADALGRDSFGAPVKFGSAFLLRMLGYSDVRGRLYQGLRHEILNEGSKEQVYADIAAFLAEADGREE